MPWSRSLVLGLDAVTSRMAGIDRATANAATELRRKRLELARVDAASRRVGARRGTPAAAA